MMEYYVEIENIKYSLVPGIPHIERLDKELDTAKVIIRKLTRSLPFKPYTIATLKLGNFERTYCIMDDQPVRISATRKIYTHTINLVSKEKLLDLEILPNLAFSNPTTSKTTVAAQLDRLRKIYPTRTLKDVNSNNKGGVFDVKDLPPELEEETNQVFLNGKSVLGSLYAILERTKLVPYLDDNTHNLKFKKLNGFGKDYTNLYLSEGNNDFTSFNANQDANYYNNFIKSNVDNGITDNLIVYPSENSFITVRSNQGEILKEDTCKLVLPTPIEYIDKVILRFNSLYILPGDIPQNAKEGPVKMDVTPFFNDKDIYNTLDTPTTAGDYSKVHQGNSFYYTKGSTFIQLNGNEKVLFFLDITKVEYFLSSIYEIKVDGEKIAAYNDDGIKVDLQKGAVSPKAKWDNLQFQVHYRSLNNAKVRAYKQEKEDVNSGITANFGENRLEVDRVVDNMFTMANRVGNETITLSRHVKNNDIETKIGDYIKINNSTYKCVETETAQYQNHKENIATFSKNFAHVSDYVGVDTEYRQYEIARNGLKRNLEYDDFVFLTTVKPDNILPTITYFSPTLMIPCLTDNDKTDTFKINTCVWGAYNKDLELVSGYYANSEKNKPFKNSKVLATVNSEGSKNTAIFNFGFNDTIIDGLAINTTESLGKTIRYNLPVLYCGKDGKMDCLEFKLGNWGFKSSTNIEEEVIKSNLYPIYDDTNMTIVDFIESSGKTMDEKLLYIDKDIAEILSMTYQIHFLPEDHNEITTNNMGEFFAYVGNAPKTINIYEREDNEPDFTAFDDIVPSDKTITPIILDLSPEISTNALSYVKIDLGNRTKKFAIVEGTTRKILFACNKPTQYIYLYTSHKR